MPPAPTPDADSREYLVRGIVQGVGFRPFVVGLAVRHGLSGWVRNDAGAVRILVRGPASAIESFRLALRDDAPPLARIDAVLDVTHDGTRDDARHGTQLERPDAGAQRGADADLVPAAHPTAFVARPSIDDPAEHPPVPPDVALCDACRLELQDPSDRRYRYPFITCTDCGPRYSVIGAMPYDRERTSLATFLLCADCAREYGDHGSRRFHAESIACPTCGPQVWLETPPPSDGGQAAAVPDAPPSRWRQVAARDAAITDAAARLRRGGIVAIRGLGGWHLACDATSPPAVAMLRARKHRDEKPLAVMVASLDDARRLADLTPLEARLLDERERPIVLVRRRADATPALAPGVAPGLARVGLMLAYTPLHLLLLEAAGVPLVMTSGNASDEPLAAGLDEARVRLAPLADALLCHDREIVARIDDSVVRAAGEAPIVLRRARGFAPLGVPLPVPAPQPILALGPHLKHTTCLAADGDAWLSPHLGDLETLETLEHARAVTRSLATLLRVTPAVIAHDLHPGYLSHRLGDDWPDLPRIGVQHHHAHIAAVMAEHGVTARVLGIAYDGTGAGDDGTVWGAEFLACDLASYERVGHWRPFPLPGGDAASRQGWRAALGIASLADEPPEWAAGFDGVAPQELALVRQQLARRLNAPLASSMGRLFDAAAAVIGTRAVARYEGQAAMELEALAEAGLSETMPERLNAEGQGGRGFAEDPLVINPLPLFFSVWNGVRQDVPLPQLAAHFHTGIVTATLDAAVTLCERHGLDTVALGGGSFQNALLLTGIRDGLAACGLRVLHARALPPNDGAISYGQAVVAAARRATA